MKLYATVTSERASKAQGGNNYLSFSFYVGEQDNQQIILDGVILREETEQEDKYQLLLSGVIADTIIIPKLSKKGEKQKTAIKPSLQGQKTFDHGSDWHN